MADFTIEPELLLNLIDAIALANDPALDQLMEDFDEMATQVAMGRSVIISIG